MGPLVQDLKYGLRMLAKSPGFTAVAVITLALGIGANTAIFSMINGILLRALPYPEPQRLYTIQEAVPQWGGGPVPVAGGNFLAWRASCPAFSIIALLEPETVSLTGAGTSRQVLGARVSADFLPMLGIRPALGRLFTPKEDQYGLNHEIILTHRFWRRQFHSDPQVVGEAVDLSGAPFTVVGVLPANFRFPKITAAPAFFEPLGLRGGELHPGFSMHNFLAIARLKPGVSASQALAQLDSVEARIARQATGGKINLYAILTPLKTTIVGPADQALGVLAAAAAALLLIICVNLANLLLVKNAGRSHEVALRSALGATPRRLTRQVLTEGFLLAAAGAALGLLVASWGLDLLVRNAPVGIPRVDGIRMDPRVLAFTLGISLVACLFFALLPALRLARVRPVEALKSSGPTVSGAKASARLRGALVIGEIAMCGALLAGALLLIASLGNVVKANNWMDEQHVLAVNVMAPHAMYGYSDPRVIAQRAQFFSDVQQKVEALPGVRMAGFTSHLPLQGSDWENGIIFREAPRSEAETPIGEYRFVSPGYFQAVGLPLIKGRFLGEGDRGLKVALISESVAQSMLPGRDPIGMHLNARDGRGWLRVIGVVGNSRTASDKPATLALYLPIWLLSRDSEFLCVRTAMDPRGAAAAIRRAVSSVSPLAAVSSEQTLKTIVQISEAPRRYETFLGALFALCAVFLSALGLYGVISYSVRQRTQEIGIRMALGARREDVLKLVVAQGLKLALAGVGIGIAAGLGLTRFLSSLLYGVKPTDPLAFIAVALTLTAVALVACYIPARRATKVDPMVALRYE